uniref:ATPase AAA-type core domain-containing protein n=2 Tax=Bionectria ochroleuca TaxID=29856 RepID=A0A0B7KGW9_BIOOC
MAPASQSPDEGRASEGLATSSCDLADPVKYHDQVELLQQKIYEAIERAGASPEENGFAAGLDAASPSSMKPPKKARRPSPGVTQGTQSKGKKPANQATQPGLPTAFTHPIDASYKKPIMFHRVTCDDLDPKCHQRLYLDSPEYNRGHLTGNKAVSDVDQFLKQRENPPFAVYRAFQCSGSGFATMTQKMSPTHTDEVVSIINKDLLSIIKRLSKFTIDLPDDKHAKSERDNFHRDNLHMIPASYPHYFFYHHRREIYSKAAGAPDGSPIKLLAQWLQSGPISMYAECDNLFSKNLVSAKTVCWLFPIDGLCIVEKGHRKLGYVVDRVGVDKEGVMLSAWNWGFNGQYLFRMYTMLRLKNPTIASRASMKIEDLGMYPLGYGSDDLTQQLLQNGAKFWRLKDQGFHAYEGWDYNRETYYTADSRWMIDYDMWLEGEGRDEYAKNPKVPRKMEYDKWGDDLPASIEPTAIQQMLLPQGIQAYNLKELKWMYLSLDQIRPVTWNKDAFNRLILPQRTKTMLKALVMTKKPAAKPPGYAETPQDRANFLVSRNGRPLIMHFHGGPGTGKSFAAAEIAEMPIFRVTCGLMGLTYEATGEAIVRSLRLAQKWKSIVVFDGLDIFIEKGPGSDLKDNRPPSAFFDCIENHDGIIILTSSDAQRINEKYTSRCQVTVSFPPLDKPARRSVWKQCLDQLRAESASSVAQGIQSHLAALSCFQLNGKQIHHAVTTARQMALFEKSKLEFRHLKDAIEVATDSDRQSE